MSRCVHGEGSLEIRLISGSNLIAADRGGTSDPYVLVELPGGSIARFKTVKKTVNPEWDDAIVFHINRPFQANGELVMSVMDWDRVSKDDFMGMAKIPFTTYPVDEWVENSFDLVPLEGTNDKVQGSIKVAIKYSPPKDFYKSDIEPVVTCEDSRRFEKPSYVNINGADFDARIGKWSGRHWDDRYVVVAKDFVYWFKDQTDNESRGFIIFNKDTEVGIGPGRGCTVDEEKTPFIIHVDTPFRDLSLNPMTEERRDDMIDFFKKHLVELGLPQEIGTQTSSMAEPERGNGTLTAKFVSGKGLKAMDANGKADPYVVLTLPGGHKVKSSVCKATLEPEWNEELIIYINRPFIKNEIGIELFDFDKASADDAMGTSKFTLDLTVIDDWQTHTLQLDDGGGEVTLSMKYIPPSEGKFMPQALEPVAVLSLENRARVIDATYANNAGAVFDGNLSILKDKEWTSRYVVFSRGVMHVFKSFDDQDSEVTMFGLEEESTVKKSDEKENAFVVTTGSKQIVCAAENSELCEWWMGMKG